MRALICTRKRWQSLREPVLGAHPSTANTYNNIGLVLYRKRYNNGAIGMYQKAWPSMRLCLGPTLTLPLHTRTLDSCCIRRETAMVPLICSKQLWQSRSLCLECTLTLWLPTTTLEWCCLKRETILVQLICTRKHWQSESTCLEPILQLPLHTTTLEWCCIRWETAMVPLICTKKLWQYKRWCLELVQPRPPPKNIGLVLYQKGDYNGVSEVYQKALASKETGLRAHQDIGTT